MDEILERLDRLSAIVALAFDDQIQAARSRIRADKASAAILDVCDEGWVTSSKVREAAAEVGAARATAGRRLAELVSLGAVQRRGAGPSTEYRSTGLL